MKKYIWLIGVTAVLSAAFVVGGRVLHSRVAMVTVQKLTSQTVEQTVFCTGKIEEAGKEALAASAGNTSVQVRVAVPENRLKQVKVGQRVTVTGTAFEADRYSGTVVSLANTAYTTLTGNTVMDAVVALDATDLSMKCGLTAKVTICVNEVKGILIPYASLCADEDGTEYVYVMRNSRAVRCNVSVEEELSDGVLITAGVTEGDLLISEPNQVPNDGAFVQEAVT